MSTPVPDIAMDDPSVSTGAVSEAVQALVSLGIAERQAALAVSAVENKELTSEEIIKEALKNL